MSQSATNLHIKALSTSASYSIHKSFDFSSSIFSNTLTDETLLFFLESVSYSQIFFLFVFSTFNVYLHISCGITHYPRSFQYSNSIFSTAFFLSCSTIFGTSEGYCALFNFFL